MNAKERIAQLRHKRTALAAEVSEAQKKIALARIDLEDQCRALQTQIQEYDGEMQRLQAKINEEESAAYVSEFFKVAAEIDKDGESPARLAQWRNLHCQLRTARLIGQSFAMCDQVTERLRSLPGTRPMPADMRTWSSVAKMWVKERVAA